MGRREEKDRLGDWERGRWGDGEMGGNLKHQISSTKSQINPNYQNPQPLPSPAGRGLGEGSFEIGIWSLFGIWDL
jgi:hypothetical protein